MRETIEVKDARENNLKNIDVEIPRNKLVVVTGMSGSGKSSLAFDTVYAEGQRRFMESGVRPGRIRRRISGFTTIFESCLPARRRPKCRGIRLSGSVLM